MDIIRPAHVSVARIVRSHGLRGEVAAEILTDFPHHLKRLAKAELWDASRHTGVDGLRIVTIRSCRLTQHRGGQAIFHFEGCDTIDQAKKLVGFEVQIPIADRVELPRGSYYVTDLAGCDVFEPGGSAIGKVRDVETAGQTIAGTPNLVIETASGELLVPLAQDICTEVDIAARRITVVLPEGLRDLNSNS